MHREQIGNNTAFPGVVHACSRSLDVGRARCHDQQPVGADLGRASKALIGYGSAEVYGGWGNHFFIIGSAAAALIGLMFIGHRLAPDAPGTAPLRKD